MYIDGTVRLRDAAAATDTDLQVHGQKYTVIYGLRVKPISACRRLRLFRHP
jgi:hypothetical protein